jgi:preprotein translocase subunit SecD
MSNLKYRVLLIVALCLASAWALYPRNVTRKVRDTDGRLHEETYRRVPLRRGLDLQGGMHMALEVDESKQKLAAKDKADAIDRALITVRNRIEGIGVSETVVQKAGNDRIIVQIPGITDPERAQRLVEESAFLEFLITDETGALEKVLPRFDQIVKEKGPMVATTAGDKPTDAAKPSSLEGLLKKADSGAKVDTSKKAADTSKKAAASDSAAADSLKLQAGGGFSSMVRVGQMPGEYMVEAEKLGRFEVLLAMPEIQAAMPPGRQILLGRDTAVYEGKTYRWFYVTETRPIIDGSVLTDAQPGTDPQSGGTLVKFELNNEGARRFKNETGKHVHDFMAIVLDKVVIGRPPEIQSVISRYGQITLGGRDLNAAQDLALVLRAGALPVPLRVAERREIGPSLGADSINKAIHAGVIAIALVVLIMLVYYKFSGVLAVGGLALYVLFTAATLAGFEAVLTLPGLAGFVLSIGIAVDANVLIFERIREELDRGKTIRTAIDEGFRHAMPAIIDSNVSTILTAAVLYQYGTGPVKGFAVTLIAGIVASLVTSIFVVRTFYLLWLNRTRGAQTLSI